MKLLRIILNVLALPLSAYLWIAGDSELCNEAANDTEEAVTIEKTCLNQLPKALCCVGSPVWVDVDNDTAGFLALEVLQVEDHLVRCLGIRQHEHQRKHAHEGLD